MINGEYYTWENIILALPSGPAVNIVNIEYSDAMNKEPIYGQSNAPRGVGRGQWTGEGTITVKREELAIILAYALAVGKAFFKLNFPITVSFLNEGSGLQVDKLKGCEFTERSLSIAADATSVEVELPFGIYTDMEMNGVSAHGGNIL